MRHPHPQLVQAGFIANKCLTCVFAYFQIFWTGDEEGVAKAVEELIDENLMTRENAIEFLNDIRLGIDYLENTYSLKHAESKNVSLLKFS